jgi:hypothetical protein
MSKVRTHLVKALARKYEAEIAEAKATMERKHFDYDDIPF